MVGKIAVQVYAPERRFCNVIDCFYLFYKLGNLFCFPFNIAPTAPSGLFVQSNAQQRKPDGAGDPQLQAADFCRTIRLKIRLNTIFG